MLLERIKTALVLVAAFILISTKSSVLVFSIVISGFMGFIAWEWAGLAGITKKPSKFTYAISFICIVGFLYQGLGFGNNQEYFVKEMSLIFLCIGLLFWISSVFFSLPLP